jgi:biotin transporter BioY
LLSESAQNYSLEAFMQIFIEVFITLSFIAALLFRDGSSYNFERFLTAILVCENFVYVIGLPILFWFIFAKGSEYASYPIIDQTK